MADAEFARMFENLGREMHNVPAVVGTQSIAQVIPFFEGDSSKFRLWIKNIEKYGVLTGSDYEKLKLISYQSSR